MNKVGWAIRELHRSENELNSLLMRASDRHKADHEIYYLGRDLSDWSKEHVKELARVGQDYGVELDPEAEDDPELIAKVRQKGSELIGRQHDAALLLLQDLRELYEKASGVSLDWEILAQTAQAMKDRELLHLAKLAHPQTLRQARWANAKLKETAAQVMVTG